MDQTTNLFVASVLALSAFAFSQEGRPAPQVPEDAFSTRQLIAWSGVQKPQPAPQPLPPRDTPVPQPDQPEDQQPASPGDPHSQQSPAAQTFTGRIIKDGGQYLLKSGNKAYHLEGQEELQKYVDQNVKVIGSLDPSGEIIRVVKIDLMS